MVLLKGDCRMKDLKPERKIQVYTGVVALFGGIFFTIVGLDYRISPWNIFHTYITEPPWLLLGLIYLYFGCVEIIQYQYIKSHYLQYPSNDLCDLCGEHVEKINIRGYSGFRLILCKKCHKKVLTINGIGLEILFLMLILLLFFIYPRLADSYKIIGFYMFLGIAVGIPPIIIFLIRRY